MRAILSVLFGLSLLGGSQVIFRVQPPGGATNPISAARQPAGNTSVPNTTWATAGVEGGIPSGSWALCDSGTATTGCQGLGPGGSLSVTSANIQTVLGAATVGGVACSSSNPCVVRIRSGDFSISALTFNESYIALRGAGANSTRLSITSGTSGCTVVYSVAINVCSGGSHIGTDKPASGGPGPDHLATWTPVGAGGSWVATQGLTVLDFNSVTSLTSGRIVVLDQIDEGSGGDGYPSTGDIWNCAEDDCTHEGHYNSYFRNYPVFRSQNEYHKVTNVSGTQVTISPGLFAPNFRSGQTPGAWWSDSGTMQQYTGIEDMTIDFTSSGVAGIFFKDCLNCWVKGSRIIYTSTTGSNIFSVFGLDVLHNSYTGNYFYGEPSGGTTGYPVSIMGGSLNLIENNIFDSGNIATASDDPESADVIAYNYVVNSLCFATAGPQPHAPGDWYNLYEGNDIGNYWPDVIHGHHHFSTLLRNMFSRGANQNGCSFAEPPAAINLASYSRFFNIVGNVLGHSSWTGYQEDVPAGSADSTKIYSFGGPGSHGCSAPCPGTDARVKATSFRWGNWDNVTSSADTTSGDQTGTRWCGNSSNTGWTTRCSSTTEVPSAITNYSNSIPSSETVPSSLYLSAKPSYFGSIAWPPIGPDVTCASNCAPNSGTVPTGGHAALIPARRCYEAATNDTVLYGGSSPPVKKDVGSNCPAF